MAGVLGCTAGFVPNHRRTVAMLMRGRYDARTMSNTPSPSSRESEFFQSRTFIETVLETAVDAIITISPDGVVHTFNRAATRIFGYTPAEVIGRNVSMLMPSPYREQHDQYIHRYLSSGKPHIIGIGREVFGLRRDGTTFPMDLSVSEVRRPDRHYFVGIIRDISERKYLEKAIVTASENERREIGRDLHDALGQSITGISLMAKSLAKKLSTQDSPQAKDAEAIASLAMEAMTEAKRLAYGAFPTELEKRGLKTALLQILETTRRNHRIETHFSAPPSWNPLDNGTELHLYRIAQESVANAIKHGHPKNIYLILERTGVRVSLTIRDDGSGMPATRDSTRISMGLDIMRHRSNLIGGNLTIRAPQSGSGTEVICCIPDTFLVSRNT